MLLQANIFGTFHMKIKNVVFDIGNVLVRWSPHEVISSIFPEQEPVKFFAQMHPVWIELNLGKLTEEEAILLYHAQLNISKEKIAQLLFEFKNTQVPIPGSVELLQKLHALNIPLYSITDNIKEIIDYYRTQRNFLHYFKGMAVSADIGILKPNAGIYRHLLEKYELNPAECVFIDDLEKNVNGALSLGMHSFQFLDAQSCEIKLTELDIIPK